VCHACGARFNTQERIWTGKPESEPEPAAFTPPGSIWLTRLDRLEASLAELQGSLHKATTAAQLVSLPSGHPQGISATFDDSVPIEQLDLRTARAYNLLKRARINTVGHLMQLTPTDLLDIRKFGVTSLTDVVEALERLGLELPRERVSA
jgi:DNA-directed RNA polymerase alpha subunit